MTRVYPVAAAPTTAKLIAVSAVMLVALAATPAQAHDGPHPWPTDGCTAAFDLAFRHACLHHDGCYALHQASRATCDRRFRDDMLARCHQRPAVVARACAATAALYYRTVRLLGGFFYHRPRANERIRTPVR